MNQLGPLGKPLSGADLPPREKWTYEQFVEKITALQTQVGNMEIAMRDLELDCAQFRIALCGAQVELFNGLTKNPFPFNPELQAVWDEGQRILRDVGLKKLGRTAPTPDWHKDRTLPH